MTDVGDDGGGIFANGEPIGKEGVLGDEDVLGLASDSSAGPQNDN